MSADVNTPRKTGNPYVGPQSFRRGDRLYGPENETADLLDVQDVEAVGNVDEALAKYYADCVADVAAKSGVSERALRDWFERELVTPQGIRGQVLQGPRSSGALGERAVGMLTDAHLVRAESHRGATWYELAHDRLIAPVQEVDVSTPADRTEGRAISLGIDSETHFMDLIVMEQGSTLLQGWFLHSGDLTLQDEEESSRRPSRE